MGMKQPLHARTLYEVLQGSPHFASIGPQIARLRTLHQHLTESLDPKLLRQCQVADFKDGILTLIVASPALGHTFRFLGTELVTKLKTKTPWQTLKGIKTLTRAPEESQATSTPKASPTNNLCLSTKSAQHLQSIASTIQHPFLQKALLKLSKRVS